MDNPRLEHAVKFCKEGKALELAELKIDKAIVDWLSKGQNCNAIYCVREAVGDIPAQYNIRREFMGETFREAVDAAMKLPPDDA